LTSQFLSTLSRKIDRTSRNATRKHHANNRERLQDREAKTHTIKEQIPNVKFNHVSRTKVTNSQLNHQQCYADSETRPICDVVPKQQRSCLVQVTNPPLEGFPRDTAWRMAKFPTICSLGAQGSGSTDTVRHRHVTTQTRRFHEQYPDLADEHGASMQ
jgi:hypothetical protein